MKYAGNLIIRTKEDAKKYADLREVTGSLSIDAEAKLDALKLYANGFDNFKIYDGISCVVLSSKKKGDIEILSCRQAKIKQQKIIGEKFFIAKKDKYTTHAEDIKTALEELQFKLSYRNIDQYKNLPKHTRKSPQDWAFVYRMVTGACQYGTKHFMESKGRLKKTYTLDEIISETQGAYGHDKFKEIVGGVVE